MKEGQKVQKSLEEKMDTTIRKEIEFEPTRDTIAEEGETISRKHLTALNKAVQASSMKLKRA